MVNSCSAINCTQRVEKGISFHSFPKDPVLVKKWLIAMRRDKWKPGQYSKICSKHFTSECYIQSGWSSQRSLKPQAVPTVFTFPQHRQKCTKERPSPRKRCVEEPEEEEVDSSLPLSPHNLECRKEQPVKKRFFHPGDFKSSEMDFTDENATKNCIELHKKVIEEKNIQIKLLKQQNRRLSKRVESLESLIEHLKFKIIAPDKALSTVEI